MTEYERIRAEIDRDNAIRNAPLCPGCGEEKPPRCVVCWKCFKYRGDDCFKYSGLSLEQWLARIGRPTLEAQGIV